MSLKLQAVCQPIVSAENGPVAVVDTFCNLLSYHETMKLIAVNGSGNGTSVNTLLHIQTLIKHNLQDTCQWVRKCSK